MEPPAKRKFKAPKNYVPPAECDPQATLAEFRRISKELRTLVQTAAGLDLARVKTSMPGAPLLRAFVKMPLGARLELITAHDRRHLWQAEAIRNHPDFPR